MKRPIAISIGDPNGIGPEIALRAHETISRLCRPIYCVHYDLIERAAKLCGCPLPDLFDHRPPPSSPAPIRPGRIDAEAGAYSYASFNKAVALTRRGECDALVTLPIHKEAWHLAGIPYKGHTDALRDFFKKEAIMMLGCEKMWVGLYTEHIPLKKVPEFIEKERLTRFLLDFQKETKAEKIAVLGLNPHAGDHGVLGDEESIITAAVEAANQTIHSPLPTPQSQIFEGPFVPDVAFTPRVREHYRYFAAMYHDQGLIPLKALYFDESVNVSLNLPIIRTSVDHGTAFDIAYMPTTRINLRSYLEAVKTAVLMADQRA